MGGGGGKKTKTLTTSLFKENDSEELAQGDEELEKEPVGINHFTTVEIKWEMAAPKFTASTTTVTTTSTRKTATTIFLSYSTGLDSSRSLIHHHKQGEITKWC